MYDSQRHVEKAITQLGVVDEALDNAGAACNEVSASAANIRHQLGALVTSAEAVEGAANIMGPHAQTADSIYQNTMHGSYSGESLLAVSSDHASEVSGLSHGIVHVTEQHADEVSRQVEDVIVQSDDLAAELRTDVNEVESLRMELQGLTSRIEDTTTRVQGRRQASEALVASLRRLSEEAAELLAIAYNANGNVQQSGNPQRVIYEATEVLYRI